MKIEHVFFDLDHTLWDFEKNSAKAFEYIFKKRAVKVDLNQFLEAYIPINLKYWRLFRNEQVGKSELRYKRLKEAFDILNYKINDSLINTLSDDYIDNLSNYNCLYDGAVRILQYLRPKYKLHIITNGFEAVQHKKMKNSGLLDFFETITTSECVGVKKPNPLIFEQAFKVSNAKPENSIMVGDSLEADIYGAKNVGMTPVFFNPDHKEIDDTEIKIINSLRELKQFL